MMSRVQITEWAWEQFQILSTEQQTQARRLIRAVQMAPSAGRPWNIDIKGRRQWVASAADTHVIYRLTYQHRQGVTLITGILVYTTPNDPNNS